ncbi:MAG: hypothetical protein KDA84_01425 [Planctomycetaceae bacterium]|nr:hypothetical protein [Planctomycetaceae bacterium]
MDIIYCLRHSQAGDLEIRYSLRSVARYFPAVGKIWIFGDRPAFLSNDTKLIEHVPHDYVAGVTGFRTPITNYFQLLFTSSLIPELSQEYLWFCDDYILLDELTPDAAKTVRYLEDLDQVKRRGRGKWLDALWRTYDILKHLGYSGLNFETHTPTYCQRKWVFEAYQTFQDYVTQDRWLGMLAPTAILNHAMSKQNFTPVNVNDENTRIGFWGKSPSYHDVQEATRGKLFMNFDDTAFGDGLRQYLQEHFPKSCRYESVEEVSSEVGSRNFVPGCFQADAKASLE